METASVKLGLIGVGSWGQIYVKTIANLDGVELVHVASRNPDNILSGGAGCNVSTDWHDVISDNTLAGVIIATPPNLHAEMACAAMDAGKAVLVEKPLALDLAEAQEIRNKALDTRCLVIVEHTHLFRPAFRAIKDKISTFGPVRGLWSRVGDRGPYRSNTPVLWDWGSHEVALALGLWEQSPISVDAHVIERQEMENGFGEICNLRLKFPGAEISDLTFGNLMDRERRFAVFLKNAVLSYDDMYPGQLLQHPAQMDVCEPTSKGELIPISQEFPLEIVIQEFASAISNGNFSIASIERGVEVTKILTQCQEQIKR